MPKKKISILFAAAECAPFAKVGGLGDVVGSLPQALAQQGLAVSVILPLYQKISSAYTLTKTGEFVVDHRGRGEKCVLYRTSLPKNPVDYFFIKHSAFSSPSPYSARGGMVEGKPDSDIEKFTFFSRAVVEAINQLHIDADIIHCHDWHTSFIPTFVDERAVTARYPFTKTLLTIHNLANQGIAPRAFLTSLNINIDTTPSLLEDYYDLDNEQLNTLKVGILSADKITTVSPTYAREIMTRQYGCGLESFLQRRHKDLSGIINGIDTQLFDPARDPSIIHYSARSWKKGKQENKQRLQKKLKLPIGPTPLYGLVSRFVSQKGLDLLDESLDVFLKNNVQIVLLGAGEKKFEQSFQERERQYPDRFRVHVGFDLNLAQQIYAASDFFLMPSLFEPCGLGQMIAMRYGSIPIVRSTGGLVDTVSHMKTGIVFTAPTAAALNRAFQQSIRLYENERAWYTIVDRIMKQDFSWENSAKKYIKLYTKLIH